MRIKLTNLQRRELENLWFIYGNYGKKHSVIDHDSIKWLLEGRDVKLPMPFSSECRKAVEQIIDFKPMQKEITSGDYVYYYTRQGDTIPARIVKVFPKTVVISGNFLNGERTVRVSRAKIDLQPVE